MSTSFVPSFIYSTGLYTGNANKHPVVHSTAPVTRTVTSSTPRQHQAFLTKKQTTGLFAFDSTDLPLIASQPSNMGLLHPHEKTPIDKERPKSARLASEKEAGSKDKKKFVSLFNFDDALTLTSDNVEAGTWMYDPLESDDDFCFNLDVETMSICSDSSIMAAAITCDTKLK